MKSELSIQATEVRLKQLIRDRGLPAFGGWEDEASETTSLVLLFDQQLQNGGVVQWYGNPTGKYFLETVASFERIGCKTIADRLVRISIEYFDTQENVPTESRQEIVDSIVTHAKVRESIVIEFDYWYENQREEVLNKLCNYLTENPGSNDP